MAGEGVCRVDLSFDEGLAAGNVAVVQVLRKIERGRNRDHGAASKRDLRDRWGDGINGIMGEMAAAKAYNRAWTPGGGRISHGELNGYEVRTAYMSGYGLLVYDADPDDAVFVFVQGAWPTFYVYRPIMASVCKRIGKWLTKFDPPCWRVDPNDIAGSSL